MANAAPAAQNRSPFTPELRSLADDNEQRPPPWIASAPRLLSPPTNARGRSPLPGDYARMPLLDPRDSAVLGDAMPYVERDAQGKISLLTNDKGRTGEFLPVEHPEVLHFLSMSPGQAQGKASDMEMLMSDLKLIRVIEDIIDLLIAKRVIIFSELPLAVQQKILQKRGKREKLFGGGADLLGSEEGIL
jgi:hypothetical protein